MNKFMVFPCLKNSGSKEAGYDGPVVTLASSAETSFVLFFPISKENAAVINYLLENKKEKYDFNMGVIGLYKTIVDSWEASGRYLAGIIMDAAYDAKHKDDVIMVKLIVADQHGLVDSIVRVNFVHAVMLAAMERCEIIITDEMLAKLVPVPPDIKGSKPDLSIKTIR